MRLRIDDNMDKKIIIWIGLGILISFCGQKNIKADILNSSEREVVAPDGNAYTLSQTNLPDKWGPLVTIVLNKPVDVAELPRDNINEFLENISIEECGAINRKPSVENIISSSNPSVHRYKHDGIDRVAWSYTFYCVR